MAVILPTGSSAGMAILRANVSASKQKIAPKTIENENVVRLLLPNNIRTMCGIINPIKPITPQNATVVATKIEDKIRTISRVLCAPIPDDCAISSPNCNTLSDLA